VISNLGGMECTQKVEIIKEKLGRIVMKERKIFFLEDFTFKIKLPTLKLFKKMKQINYFYLVKFQYTN
jgi:hypothetical protein